MDSKINVPALIDTGFDGYLALPISTAMSLGLKLIDTVIITLADGSTRQELVFGGKVKIGDESKISYILLTAGETALVGTQLLKDFTLSIDFPDREISLLSR